MVRKRGQLELWTRSVDRMPSTTTQLSRISVTAPAPRVVYQRMLLVNVECEAPDTTEPVLVDEPTPLDGCKLRDALDELEDGEDDALDACEPHDVVPGFVSALTGADTPA